MGQVKRLSGGMGKEGRIYESKQPAFCYIHNQMVGEAKTDCGVGSYQQDCKGSSRVEENEVPLFKLLSVSVRACPLARLLLEEPDKVFSFGD